MLLTLCRCCLTADHGMVLSILKWLRFYYLNFSAKSLSRFVIVPSFTSRSLCDRSGYFVSTCSRGCVGAAIKAVFLCFKSFSEYRLILSKLRCMVCQLWIGCGRFFWWNILQIPNKVMLKEKEFLDEIGHFSTRCQFSLRQNV